jgi:hypothetical protein
MKSVVFHNDGLIPLDALRIMGVNAKDRDDAIGHFGTGAKYAISIFLRSGQDVKIIRDGEEFSFSFKLQEIRGKHFNVVHMNDEQLAYTGELGKNWEIWQAFREIYCNALDEHGSVELMSSEEIQGMEKSGKTIFVVTGQAVLDEYHNRHKIVLNDVKPIHKFENTECYRNTNDSKWIYYRGVRVHELTYKPKYTWNITSELQLTEDRTLRHPYVAIREIAKAIFDCTDKKFIESCIVKRDDLEPSSEYTLSYDHLHRDPSEEFLEVCRETVEDNIIGLSAGALSKFHDIDGVPMPEELEISDLDKDVLEECIEFVQEIGYPVRDYEIVVSKDLGNNVLGLAHDKKIFVSNEAFRRGKKMVAAALIEEYTHLSTGYSDETRELQTRFLLDIVDMGEKFVWKKPL